MRHCSEIQLQSGYYSQGRAKRIGRAQDKDKKWGPTIWIVRGGSGGIPPENVENLHALKCVLGAPEALFFVNSHSIYIPASCRLQLAVFKIEKYDLWGPSYQTAQ